MSGSDHLSSLSLSGRIDALCDEFEVEFRAGRRPKIQTYLDRVPVAEQAALLRELIAVDIECRVQQGESPAHEDYGRLVRDGASVLTELFPPVENIRNLADQSTVLPNEQSSVSTDAAAAEDSPGQVSPSEVVTIIGRADSDTDSKGTAPSGRSAVALSIPGYEILSELGRGGMGVVYKAQQHTPKRIVALKMVLAAAHSGPVERARFLSEADAIARLRHPNVVQVYEVGQHDGQPYFSLEYCEGGTLAEKLAGTPLPPEDAARMLRTIAEARSCRAPGGSRASRPETRQRAANRRSGLKA